jgi:hypothetical protein
VIDFFHAAEHLHAAIATTYGDGTRETQYRFESLRETLRDDEQGVQKVIHALKHLATKHRRSDTIRQAHAYFRKHRSRTRYADMKAHGLMIGSSVVEAVRAAVGV